MSGCTLKKIKAELLYRYPDLVTRTGQFTRSPSKKDALRQAIKEIFPEVCPGVELTGEYSSIKTPLQVRCVSCGLGWRTFLDRKITCPSCGTCRKLTTEVVRNRLRSSNIRLLTPIQGAKDRGVFACLQCNNVWKTQVSSITNNNTGCPSCSRVSNYLYMWTSTCGVLKVGITTRSNFLSRVSSVLRKHELELDDLIHFYLPQGATGTEALLLSELRKDYVPYTRSTQDGHTEMFECPETLSQVVAKYIKNYSC
ncbi:hypothetical protein VspSw1_39 [Vibrio phage VspSw_1]|uniref:Uncharacterized protein n=2 Tax=Pogseptimavirus VspSw1 TaxID=2733997 RepID=A0A411BKN1_9CAUD|nr:endonuclease [Vibrio phage VspSw_1]QAY02112.1 hypothetical protein VspSw1_39 [Vibrio phage VspSw_1]QKN88433.1 hypothetical protein vBValSX1_40 [Vibrio phage vB_ValS_X1]